MSDGFIPLNQSTPVQNKWQPGKQQNQRNYQNNRFQNGHRRSGYNRWGNNSRNSTFGVCYRLLYFSKLNLWGNRAPN